MPRGIPRKKSIFGVGSDTSPKPYSEEARTAFPLLKKTFNYRRVVSPTTLPGRGINIAPLSLQRRNEVAEMVEMEHTPQASLILGTKDYDFDVHPEEKKTYVPIGVNVRSETVPNKIFYSELFYPGRSLKREVIYDLLKKRGTMEVTPIGTEKPWWEKIGAERRDQPGSILLGMPHVSATTLSEQSERIPMKLTRSAFEASHLSEESPGPFGDLNPEHLPRRILVPVEVTPKEYGWEHIENIRTEYGGPRSVYKSGNVGFSALHQQNKANKTILSVPHEERRQYREQIRTYVEPIENIADMETKEPRYEPRSPLEITLGQREIPMEDERVSQVKSRPYAIGRGQTEEEAEKQIEEEVESLYSRKKKEE